MLSILTLLLIIYTCIYTCTASSSPEPIAIPVSVPVSVSIDIQLQEYDPRSPLVKCHYLPVEFVVCEEPVDHKGNITAREEVGHGCAIWGGVTYNQVEKAKAQCSVLPDIECWGPRSFLRDGFPCVRYSRHYFTATLIYSLLLGFLGMDRFCLGQTGTAVGKLLTVGGLGLWWLVDIVLLVTDKLHPEDGSNWNPYV